ncbi:hypothetical protein ACFLQR_01175 [Verrucomicrobiota bacterium]
MNTANLFFTWVFIFVFLSASRTVTVSSQPSGIATLASMPLCGSPPEITEWVVEPWLDDPFPDYDTEPVMMYANG